MPIYEFYCVDCHTIFNFFSRRINTEKRPNCPKCGRPDLERRLSLFAISKGRKENEDGPIGDIDEQKLERMMASMASEIEGADEDDPRQAARVMRKLFDAAGLPMGPHMEEAMHRMEAGEDPDKIEEELGDVLQQEDPLVAGGKRATSHLKALRRELLPPKQDETLYDL
ncbi:MAG: zinc ribbon domain-containing protein [Gammaproteobacteria bacterium]